MEFSPYFQRAILSDQSQSLADSYRERTPSLFVTDLSQSWIEGLAILPGSRLVVENVTQRDAEKEHDYDSVDEKHESSRGDDLTTSHAQRQALDSSFLNSDRPRKLTQCKEVQTFVEMTSTQSRIFLIRQRNSYSRLLITRSLFDCFMMECQIFAQFNEYIICFGTKSGENEVGPPHFRFRNHAGLGLPASVGFECGYVLRFVELNYRGKPGRPWSLRQFAVYHKFESASKASTWLFVALSKRVETRLDAYLQGCSGVMLPNPFEMHVLLLDMAISNWRPYLIYLTTETNSLAARVVAASVDDDSLVRFAEFTEYQRLKQIDDDLLDVLIILESTVDTINSLSDGYASIDTQEVLGSLAKISSTHDWITISLEEQRRDLQLQQAKVKTLRSKVASTSELVSSLLDLGNGHSLKTLAEESKAENANMRELTLKGFQDAVAIKVLTIVTLVYLPATVVSNFFSTQFVSQEAGKADGSGPHLVVASNWWIFVASSVPLTMITIYVWWFYVQKQAYGSYPRWFEIIASSTKKSKNRVFGRRPDESQRDAEIREVRDQ